MIFGGIFLQGCVFGALLRPVDNHRNNKKVETEITQKGTDTIDELCTEFTDENKKDMSKKTETCIAVNHAKDSNHDILSDEKQITDEMKKPKTKSILRIRQFMLYYIGSILGLFGNPLEYIYIPEIAVGLGGTMQQVALLASVLGKFIFY